MNFIIGHIQEILHISKIFQFTIILKYVYPKKMIRYFMLIFILGFLEVHNPLSRELSVRHFLRSNTKAAGAATAVNVFHNE